MDWLQSLDVSVFRFINDSLSNPVFDRLMPFLSGNAFFYPVLLVLAVWMMWKCGTRGRLCALFIFIVIAVGDGVFCKTLKEVIGRDRPFHTLPNVHLPPGIGMSDSPSMPSSHSANWFSATMVAFIFYRRSWRFMLPLACLVAFSRVYNGVHYPADVTLGALYGAAYAVAIVFGLNAFWQAVGHRWFPIWWRKLPSLVDAPCEIPRNSVRDVSADQHFVHAGYLLIGVLLLVRLAYLAAGKIELSEDEAYQWLWSKHLALSYYSKPPMIAYAQWLGTTIWGDTQLGVRFFSPVIGAIISFLVLRFFAREANARLGFLAIIVINCTPLLAGGAILMTIDPLLILFWTAAMFVGWRAVQPNGTTAQWSFAGLLLGLSFLSKYAAAYQIVCWALFFALWKPARIHLRKPGPYIALVLFLLCTIPVLVWNAQHDWITVKHVGENASRSEPWQFTVKHLIDFLLVESVLLNPIFFILMLVALVAFWRNPKARQNPVLLFFFSMGAPVFLGYAAFSLYKKILPNWIAPAVLPLFCLALIYWEQRWKEGLRAVRLWLSIGIGLGAAAIVLLHDTNLIGKIAGNKLPATAEPLRRVRGWYETAQLVGTMQRKLEAEGEPAFIIATHYGLVGEISFYLPEARDAANERKPLVYYRTADRPQNQLYFWPEYRYLDTRKGQNAIFVHEIDIRKPQTHYYDTFLKTEFATVEDWGIYDIYYRDRIFRRLQIYACRELK